MTQFGTLDGEPVYRLKIGNDRLSAHILNYGAVVQDLRLAAFDHPLVLGFQQFDHYLKHSPYFGVIAGRCANRIKDGHLPLEGTHWQLDLNEADKTHLHGGSKGIGQRVWQVLEHKAQQIHLRITCQHGEMGYPGNLTIDCRISIKEPAILVFDLTAETDATTLCNLAQHSYFNLDASPTINDHVLQINADHYLPVDAAMLPTGEIRDVSGTEFDFREGRALGSEHAFDHNFCLSSETRKLTEVARLTGTKGISLLLHTTEPGLQFYDGGKMSLPVSGLDGLNYADHAGLCLEPQRWPDSIHHPRFAGAILRKSEQYQQRSEYRFSTAN